MTNIPGVNIPGTITPFTDADTYPTHDSKYGVGGWREVASVGERNAIPAARLRAGMVVYVQGDQPYLYTGSGWTPLTTGGGGGGGTFPDAITAPASTNLTSGQLVSLFQDVDTIVKVRPADAGLDFAVTGYVVANYTTGQSASVKLEGVFTVVNTNLGISEVGGPVFLDQSVAGTLSAGASAGAFLYQRVGTLLAYDTPTHTATILFDASSINNFDIISFINSFENSKKDHANGLAGLDSSIRVFDFELNKNYTLSTDLTSAGSTMSLALTGSDLYVFTGTPASLVSITLTAGGGVSFGRFTVKNNTNQILNFTSAITQNFNIPPGGMQSFAAPTGSALIPLSEITPTKAYYNTAVDLDISLGAIPGQDIVVAGSAGGSDIAITIPTAATVPGARLWIVKVDNGIGKVNIQPGINDFIGPGQSNGQLFTKLALQFDSIVIVSDGSDWEPVGGAPFTAPANQFLTRFSPSGDIHSAQPSAENLSNGVLGTGAVVLASAKGSYTLNLGGVNIPLSGVKFPNASGINLSTGNHDLYTCPVGKKAVVIDVIFTVPTGNPTSVTGLAQVKISGTYHVYDFFVLGGTAGTYGGSNSVAPFLLAAGEIFSVNTDHNGLSAWASIIEFDDTVNITDARLLTLASGANTLFTMPSSKTIAFMAFPSAFSLTNVGRVWYYNASLASRAVKVHAVPSGGSPGVTNAIFDGSVPTGQMGQPLLYGGLAVGDFIDITTDSSAAGQIAWIIFTEV